MGLKLKNGGLGIHSVTDYCDSAMLGMWATNVQDILSSLGPLSDVEKDFLRHSRSITHISEIARTMKTKFAEDNAFTQAQVIDIGLRSGKLSTMELLTMLTKHAATNNDDSRKLKGGKHQGKLRSALNLYIANRYTDSIVPPDAS